MAWSVGEIMNNGRARYEWDYDLTGGTAVPRVYRHHRFSDDRDRSANLQSDFGVWCGRVIDALMQDSR